MRYVVVAAVCLGAVAWMVVGGLASNIVYLRPVSEAVERRESDGERKFRMGGEVVPGTIVDEGGVVRFEMSDGEATARAVYEGTTPDLFDDRAPVVCEGRWSGETFACDRVLIRHGNEYDDEYTPPEVDEPTPEPASGGGS